jgi:hypothetical protein
LENLSFLSTSDSRSVVALFGRRSPLIEFPTGPERQDQGWIFVLSGGRFRIGTTSVRGRSRGGPKSSDASTPTRELRGPPAQILSVQIHPDLDPTRSSICPRSTPGGRARPTLARPPPGGSRLGIGDALRRRHGHAERRRRGALGSGGPGGPGVTGGRGDEGDGPRGSPGSLAGGPRLVPRAGSPLLGRGPLDRPTRPLLRRVLAGHVPRSTGLNPTSPARRRSTGLGSSPPGSAPPRSSLPRAS